MEREGGVSPPFSYLFNILPSPPVTPLRSAFGPYREKVAYATETAGDFQGNGRVACVDFGKRLDAGSGTAAYRYSERVAATHL